MLSPSLSDGRGDCADLCAKTSLHTAKTPFMQCVNTSNNRAVSAVSQCCTNIPTDTKHIPFFHSCQCVSICVSNMRTHELLSPTHRPAPMQCVHGNIIITFTTLYHSDFHYSCAVVLRFCVGIDSAYFNYFQQWFAIRRNNYLQSLSGSRE